MKHIITVFSILVFLTTQSQRTYEKYLDTISKNGVIIDVFNTSGFYKSGMIITEELYLFSDSSFLYYNGKDSNFHLTAMGTYSQDNKDYFFDYRNIILETISTDGEEPDVNSIQLFSELKLVKSKNYIKNTFPDLIKYTKPMSNFRSYLVHGKKYKYTNKLFLPRREHFQLVKSINPQNLKITASR